MTGLDNLRSFHVDKATTHFFEIVIIDFDVNFASVFTFSPTCKIARDTTIINAGERCAFFLFRWLYIPITIIRTSYVPAGRPVIVSV